MAEHVPLLLLQYMTYMVNFLSIAALVSRLSLKGLTMVSINHNLFTFSLLEDAGLVKCVFKSNLIFSDIS